MIRAPIGLQELRRRIYRKAKSETTHRFWGLFVHITKIETLEEAYRIAKSNGGAPGIDGQKFQDIETAGRAAWLAAVREDLITGRYKPKPNRRVEIPKGNGKFRTLQIPCIRDRVVQGALKLILEAVFEADFCPTPTDFDPSGHHTKLWPRPGGVCCGACPRLSMLICPAIWIVFHTAPWFMKVARIVLAADRLL